MLAGVFHVQGRQDPRILQLDVGQLGRQGQGDGEAGADGRDQGQNQAHGQAYAAGAASGRVVEDEVGHVAGRYTSQRRFMSPYGGGSRAQTLCVLTHRREPAPGRARIPERRRPYQAAA